MANLPQRVIEDILIEKTPINFEMVTTREGKTYLVLQYDKDLEITAVYPKAPCQDKRQRSQLCPGSIPDCQPYQASKPGTGPENITPIRPAGCKVYYKCAQSVRIVSVLPQDVATLLGRNQQGKY